MGIQAVVAGLVTHLLGAPRGGAPVACATHFTVVANNAGPSPTRRQQWGQQVQRGRTLEGFLIRRFLGFSDCGTVRYPSGGSADGHIVSVVRTQQMKKTYGHVVYESSLSVRKMGAFTDDAERVSRSRSVAVVGSVLTLARVMDARGSATVCKSV